MIDSIGFLVFVLAIVYVMWWSFRHDDAARLAAIDKAANIKRQVGLSGQAGKDESAGD